MYSFFVKVKSARVIFLLALASPVLFLLVPLTPPPASADITCLNSDYNCIYVDITNGDNGTGNRIVCTRAVCGGGSFGGRQYRLEGVYAFDGGDRYNTATSSTTVAGSSTSTTVAGSSTSTTVAGSSTSTTVAGSLVVSLSGATVTVACSGSFYYSGGTYTDSGFTRAWNTTSRSGDVLCGYSGSFDSSNLQAGQTYYISATYFHASGSVTVTGSFVASASTTTTTTILPVTTTTIAGAPVNPCLDPANPNYACGWAVLGPNNEVGGVIVCTFAVCGSGSFGGMRLALQAQQTPDGNVAGYTGGTYNEATQTFTLPGGGTLRSGDKLDEAVFPTTTTIAATTSTIAATTSTIAATTTTTTINGGTVAETVKQVLASSGVLYKDPDSYVKGETQVAVTASQLVISLPPITSSRAEFVVTFDPDGPKPPRVIDEGIIIDGRIQREPQLRNTSDSPSAGLTSRNVLPMNWVNVNASKSSPSDRLAVSVSSLEQESGVVAVTIVVAGSTYSKFPVKIQRPKKYLSCRMLLRDYPGGISAPGRVVDRNPGKMSAGRFKPTISLRVFTLNKALDSDGDRIACESVGEQAKSSRP